MIPSLIDSGNNSIFDTDFILVIDSLNTISPCTFCKTLSFRSQSQCKWHRNICPTKILFLNLITSILPAVKNKRHKHVFAKDQWQNNCSEGCIIIAAVWIHNTCSHSHCGETWIVQPVSIRNTHHCNGILLMIVQWES